jgi:hypothetical protein
MKPAGRERARELLRMVGIPDPGRTPQVLSP